MWYLCAGQDCLPLIDHRYLLKVQDDHSLLVKVEIVWFLKRPVSSAARVAFFFLPAKVINWEILSFVSLQPLLLFCQQVKIDIIFLGSLAVLLDEFTAKHVVVVAIVVDLHVLQHSFTNFFLML